MTESNAKPDQSTQLECFKEASRQLEANESEAAFDEKLKGILGHKPPVERDPKKKA